MSDETEDKNRELLRIEDLRISFRSDEGDEFEAVKGISFHIDEGETVAVVGESGSGKSVTALSLARLLPEPPAHYGGGRIWLRGRDVLGLDKAEMRGIRGNEIAYIFQEPATSLNPVFTIRNQMAEMINLHRTDVDDVDNEIVYWLDQVGIVDPDKRLRDYPHQLSGGMQQRVMIAMALCAQPHLLVADEPTTALDVTIQAQIIDLLSDLKEKHQMAIMLITHNFGIIQNIADRVIVMFRGKIVEQGATAEVLDNPQHPYTQALIDCIPKIGERRERLTTIDYDKIEGFEAIG
jgi:ABC-type dipeptide/oligopeptide/nickel transport system ATPase component